MRGVNAKKDMRTGASDMCTNIFNWNIMGSIRYLRIVIMYHANHVHIYLLQAGH